MDLSEIRETRIIESMTDYPGGENTDLLNEFLQVGWIILHVYIRINDKGSTPQPYPCFVIGWPKEIPAKLPEGWVPKKSYSC
jgi:hypothetical protein